jgi:hypothetical protein
MMSRGRGLTGMQLSVEWLRFEPQKVGATNTKLVPIITLLSERIVEATLQWKAA